MRTVTIQLTRDDLAPAAFDTNRVLGEIVWEVEDEEAGLGKVVSVDIPGDLAVEREIKRHLNGNPDGLPIDGGLTPDDLGTYSDGLRAVIAVTALADNIERFAFDFSAMPAFEFGPDEIG